MRTHRRTAPAYSSCSARGWPREGNRDTAFPSVRSVARVGLIDRRTQTNLRKLLRSDIPPQVAWNVKQAQGANCEEFRRANDTANACSVRGVHIADDVDK